MTTIPIHIMQESPCKDALVPSTEIPNFKLEYSYTKKSTSLQQDDIVTVKDDV